MVSVLRPVLRASRLVTSAGPPPARARRRARSIIIVRSSGVSWLNCAPRANALPVLFDKPLHRTLQKPDPLPAADHKPPADQAVPPPAGNGLGGDVELPGQFLDRQHPLARRFRRHPGRIGDVLDEQPQVVAGLLTGKPQIGIRFGPVVGHAVADVFVRIRPRGVQLPQQPLGQGRLFDSLFAGRKRTCWSRSCRRAGFR